MIFLNKDITLSRNIYEERLYSFQPWQRRRRPDPLLPFLVSTIKALDVRFTGEYFAFSCCFIRHAPRCVKAKTKKQMHLLIGLAIILKKSSMLQTTSLLSAVSQIVQIHKWNYSQDKMLQLKSTISIETSCCIMMYELNTVKGIWFTMN